MKHPISFLGGCIAGALAMYYLDQQSGAWRRRLVRDKMLSAGNDLAHRARRQGQRAIGRARGALATGHLDGRSTRAPDSDRQLHDRIRARLRRLVSHPRLVEVQVEQGRVCFTGHALRRELPPLLDEVRAMAGVHAVEDRTQAHEHADELRNIPAHAATGSAEQAGREPAWH